MTALKKSKKSASPITDNNAAATTVPLSIAAVPAGEAPPVPLGFEAAPKGHQKGLKPTRGQVTDAPGAAAEVLASATWAADFTEKLPQATLALLLENASGWRAKLANAEAWAAYVRQSDIDAWKVTLGKLEPFKLAFAYASKNNAAIATRYPQLARILGVRKEAGARGAKTRVAIKNGTLPPKPKRAKKAPATAHAAKPAVIEPTAPATAVTNGAPIATTNGASNVAPHA